MKIQVQDIPLEGLSLSYEVGPTEWGLAEQGVVLLEAIHVVVNVLKQAGEEVYLSGALSTVINTECSRCLKSLSLPLQSDFHLMYVPFPSSSSEGEMALSAEALDLNFYHGGEINVDQEMRGQLFLSIPMHPLCHSDCRGLCPHCGEDLNQVRCQCHSEPVDLRWKGLEKFKYKENDAKSKT